jgi:hypothetical protein
MNYVGYIGYKDRIGTTLIPVITGEPISSAIATAVATAFASWNDWFSHPAQDAKDLISSIKPQLAQLDARSRITNILAATQKISPKAKDVEAEKLLLWYRQSYPEDYKTLMVDDKLYFNNYILSVKNTRGDGNNMYANLDRSMFTNNEINYNANPVQSITNLLSNKNNLLIYGGIALALVILLKK